jgi:formamidopyrimidine-DNA glycosylase
MPELPEVETVRRNLDRLLVGATIVDVHFGDFTGSIANPAPEIFAEELRGRRFVGTSRRGKYLLLQLDSGDVIAVHLRMTGDLYVANADEPWSKHLHLALRLADGRELRFADVRTFGRIWLLTPPELEDLDERIGPEPLDPAFTAEQFHERLQGRSRAIKALLLEQSFVAGVGNIYADEALFAAQIHPLRAASSLSLAEADTLLSAIRLAFQSAIDRGGTTIRNYRNGLGEAGGNQHYLQIYTLTEGDPCPRCATPISRIVVAQRGTRFCATCQPLEAQA